MNTTPDPDDRDLHAELAEVEVIDEYLAPAADAIAALTLRLAELLIERDLISSRQDHVLDWLVDLATGELVNGIVADLREGRRLYVLEGWDTIIAYRMRDDGDWEKATLDANGQPIKWRAVAISKPS